MGIFVKTKATGTPSWRTSNSLFLKVSPTSWKSVSDAWVKVSHNTWKSFFSAPTEPSSPIEILTSYTTTSELLRLQGKNYRWTPTPTTLQYKFKVINASNTGQFKDIISFTNTSNPSSSSTPITVPSSSTYETISVSSGNYYSGVVNIFQFIVKATTASGAVVEKNAEYQMRIPAAPTLSVQILSSTSAKLTITAASSDDFNSTYNYIVYRYDSVSGTVYGTTTSTNGLGGVGASTDPTETTLTGLVNGRDYIFYVLPVTGSSGARPFAYNSSTETSGYTGYPGVLAQVNHTQQQGYTFAFGNVLNVSTNGYIGLGSTGSSDSIPTTGTFLSILPQDLQQSSTNSIWYWSNTTEYVIRWEGYRYGDSSKTRIYQVKFYKDADYVDVYAINVTDNSGIGTQAYVVNNSIRASYSSALSTGEARRINFTTNAVTTISSAGLEKDKSIMKQVTGLTSGSTDVGYTSLTSATNQVNFTQGTVSVSGGDNPSQKVTNGATLSISTSNWPTGTTFTYQWKKTRYISGLSDINQGTSSSQAVSTNGEYVYCQIQYSNADYGVSNETVYTNSYLVVPDRPTYTLSNLTTGSARISSVSSTYGTRYRGSWRIDTSGGTSYGSSTTISTTLNSSNTDISSGNGNLQVTLYGVATVTYSGDINPTEIISYETTIQNVTVTTSVQFAGSQRRINLPSNFTSGTTVYVSTNGFIGINSNPQGAIAIPTSGVYLGIMQADLRQGATTGSVNTVAGGGLWSFADANNFYIRWKGNYLPDANQLVEYQAKFYWDSTSVDVYFIANSLSSVVANTTAISNNGSITSWSSSTAQSSSLISTSSMTRNTQGDGIDDTSTAITATKPATGPTVTSTSYIAPTTTAINNTFSPVDDNNTQKTLPFTTYFNGTAYSSIYVGTNSYVTFGGGSNAYSSLSASNPAFDKIMVDAADRGSTGFYFTSNASSWTMRYEGSSGTTGSPIAIIWEISASSTNNKRIRVSIKQVAGGGTTGVFSSSANIGGTNSGMGGAGTSWYIDSQ